MSHTQTDNHTGIDTSAEAVAELADRLDPPFEFGPTCKFCGRDPYEYVDNGVGLERVAVSCCDLGIALYQYSDELLAEVAGLIQQSGATIRALSAELTAQRSEAARLKAALEPFAKCADEMDAEASDPGNPRVTDDEDWAKFRLLAKHYRMARAALADGGTHD